MAWEIKITQTAEKELSRIDKTEGKQIISYLRTRVALNPRQFGKALKSNLSGLWRYRVGNYGVVCNIEDEKVSVLVIRIAHRKEVYK